MHYETLMNGYKKIISTIYSPKQYYERIKTFLKEYKPRPTKEYRPQFGYLWAFIKSMWVLGLKEKGRRYYWRLLAWTLVRRPRSLPTSVALTIYGFHFRKVMENYTDPRV